MPNQALVFIDTNIILDFYRVIGSESGLSILKHIDDNHDKIITTSQVEMEYKKHRQRIIIDAQKELRSSVLGRINPPAFLRETQAAKAIAKNMKAIETQIKKLQERTEKCLKNPSRNDPVYKAFQRLFRANTTINLSREKEARLEIRELAEKRFLLGYPPRKDSDTSFGDAINWEWIIRCASERASDIVIVSRDSDFGPRFGKSVVINDWLAQEFKQRVGRRSITLTGKLTEGFKLASIRVTPKEERDEEELLKKKVLALSGFGKSLSALVGAQIVPNLAALVNPAGDILDQTRSLNRAFALLARSHVSSPTESEIENVDGTDEV